MCRASTCVLLSTCLGCLCILSITAAFVRLGGALGLIRSVAQSYRGFMVGVSDSVASERGARAMSEGRRREMEGGGDGGEGRGGDGGGGGENGGTEFVSVSGGRRSSGGARSLLTGALLSLGAHATATGVPGNGDRARAAFTTRARSSRSRVPRGKRSFRPTSSGAQGSRRSAGGVALHGPAGCSGEGRRARTSTESLRAAGGARARARKLSAG